MVFKSLKENLQFFHAKRFTQDVYQMEKMALSLTAKCVIVVFESTN